MPRNLVIQQAEYPYHITARCINREWFLIPMDDVWEIMCRHLYFISMAMDVRIQAFTLMTNHFHLIAQTPLANVSQALHYFMTNTSRDLVLAGNRINQTYGKRNFKTILSCHQYYLHAYKYVYRNPVEAKLVERVEDYKYSSLYGLLGRGRIYFPVEEDTQLFGDVTGTLEWLNRTPREEDKAAVQKALGRSKFILSRHKNSKTAHPLEVNPY